MMAGTESLGGISASETAAFDDGGPEKLDLSREDGVPDGDADEAGTPEPCRKVDMVLAVDNSESMTEEMDAIRGPVFDSLPPLLLDEVQNGLDDFRLAVIDACPKPANYHDTGPNGACDYSTDKNWMESTAPDLAAEFSCATTYITDAWQGMPDACIDDGAFQDDDEQPALTVAAALEADEGPNGNFLRKDALLFVVAMTDEDEELLDAGSAQEIYDRIVATKGGDPGRVVFMGVGGGSDCDGPYGGALQANNLRDVTQLFETNGNGMFWDLCDGDLPGAFEAVITGKVDEACGDFTPVG